jgi:hypothetical protein
MKLLIITLWSIYFLIILSESDTFKKFKFYLMDKRKKKYLTQPLSENHPEVYLWEEGDKLIYQKTPSMEGVCNLLTFSQKEVIAQDAHDGSKLILPGKLIIENTTHKYRISYKKAKQYQQHVLPEIIKDTKYLTQ